MVSHAVHKPDSAGVYRFAKGRVAEVPAALWLWGLAGTTLDIVLWQHQGLERLDRCDLFLSDRLLHGPFRTPHLSAKAFVA